MFEYKETIGWGCDKFTKVDEYEQVHDGLMYDDKVIVSYNDMSRTLRVDYRAFCGQKLRAIKKFLGEDLYNFLKKNKGKDTAYGEYDNDDNPQRSIVRFIQ